MNILDYTDLYSPIIFRLFKYSINTIVYTHRYDDLRQKMAFESVWIRQPKLKQKSLTCSELLVAEFPRFWSCQNNGNLWCRGPGIFQPILWDRDASQGKTPQRMTAPRTLPGEQLAKQNARRLHC